MILGIYRAWRDSFKALFRSFKNGYASVEDGGLIYGGSSIPLVVLFKNRVLNNSDGYKLLSFDECQSKKYFSDSDRLSKLPDNTLGKQYFLFMQGIENNMDNMLLGGNENNPTNRKWVSNMNHKRKQYLRLFEEMRCQHDIMHVLTGYSTDVRGEIGLHAFLIRHLYIPAPFLVSFGWCLYLTITKGDFSYWTTFYTGIINGFKAKWLFPVDWSKYIERDINDVRKEFNILY